MNAQSRIRQRISDVGKSGIATVVIQRFLWILDPISIEANENPDGEKQAANQTGHGTFLIGKGEKYAQQKETQERPAYDSKQRDLKQKTSRLGYSFVKFKSRKMIKSYVQP